MGVRLFIAFDKLAKRQEAFYPFALGKLPQAAENGRVDGEELIQASL